MTGRCASRNDANVVRCLVRCRVSTRICCISTGLSARHAAENRVPSATGETLESMLGVNSVYPCPPQRKNASRGAGLGMLTERGFMGILYHGPCGRGTRSGWRRRTQGVAFADELVAPPLELFEPLRFAVRTKGKGLSGVEPCLCSSLSR